VCGDGQIGATETCDDGNAYDRDGCAGTSCSVENGYTCTGTPSQCAFGPNLDGSILLAEMTSEQLSIYCQWSVAAAGGEGAMVKCSASPTGTASVEGVDACIADSGVDPTCQATLSAWLDCAKPLYVSGADFCLESPLANQCLTNACAGTVP
jgi:cysteine-rich repeat protein